MIQFKPFYANGLHFTCTRCSTCCRHETGFVYLSENDVSSLALELKLPKDQFMETYCRWIPALGGTERLSLKEKPDFDCIFWAKGCKVYNSRPLQCRMFPFWSNVLASKEAWDISAEDCPGMNEGKLFTFDEIKLFLSEQETNKIVSRKKRGL